jgi:hypothetical protein
LISIKSERNNIAIKTQRIEYRHKTTKAYDSSLYNRYTRIQERFSAIYVSRLSVQISNKFYHGDINIVFRSTRPKRVGKRQTDNLRVFLAATIIPCV